MTEQPNPSPTDDRDAASQRLRVIVAGGDVSSRHTLAELIRSPGGIVVVAQSGSVVETLELVGHYHPDVLVVEEALLCALDFGLARELRDAHPDLAVVMLTAGPRAERPLEALRAGATSIITAAGAPETLVAALHASARGDALIDPDVTRALIDEVRRLPAPGSGLRPIHSALSNREWQILGLMSDGASAAEIATALTLTQDTVYTHTRNILRKLQVENREEAVLAARRHYGSAT
jgi:DNA-binding NarL/FixJ family response regulator